MTVSYEKTMPRPEEYEDPDAFNENLREYCATRIYSEAMSGFRSEMIRFVERLSGVLSEDDAIRLTAAAFDVPYGMLRELIPDAMAS